MSDDVRRAAAATVAEIADRLSDPDAVVAVTESSGDDGVESVLWTPGSLNDGYPAVALLHAELGRFDDRFRTIAHRYLELAAKQDRFQPSGELDGPCAVAIAMRAAAQDPGDYATPLGRLDEHVIGNAHWLIAMQQAAHRNREPTRPVVIDTLTGLAGLGRHLLARAPVNPDAATAVREVLIWLSALREPIDWHGTTVPGWWYHKTALLGAEDDAAAFEWGSATLGLSHGIAGPMALLGYAWQAGYRVPGQDDALRTMAEWLLDWLHPDGYWPMHVPLTHYRDRGVDPPPSSLVGWCHGTWGIAYAVAVAGRALDRPDWTAAATEVVHRVLKRCEPGWNVVRDNSLCHGWAGVLYQLCRFGWDDPALGLEPAADDVAERLIAEFRPGNPFGYRYRHPTSGWELDLPGLLEGATGVALVLSAYANDRPPASGWDTVLMLS